MNAPHWLPARRFLWLILVVACASSGCEIADVITDVEVPEPEIPEPTVADLIVQIDQGTCSHIAYVEAYLDGVYWTNLQFGQPATRTVSIGNHIFFGRGYRSDGVSWGTWGNLTWSVPAEGIRRILTCG